MTWNGVRQSSVRQGCVLLSSHLQSSQISLKGRRNAYDEDAIYISTSMLSVAHAPVSYCQPLFDLQGMAAYCGFKQSVLHFDFTCSIAITWIISNIPDSQSLEHTFISTFQYPLRPHPSSPRPFHIVPLRYHRLGAQQGHRFKMPTPKRTKVTTSPRSAGKQLLQMFLGAVQIDLDFIHRTEEEKAMLARLILTTDIQEEDLAWLQQRLEGLRSRTRSVAQVLEVCVNYYRGLLGRNASRYMTVTERVVHEARKEVADGYLKLTEPAAARLGQWLRDYADLRGRVNDGAIRVRRLKHGKEMARVLDSCMEFEQQAEVLVSVVLALRAEFDSVEQVIKEQESFTEEGEEKAEGGSESATKSKVKIRGVLSMHGS